MRFRPLGLYKQSLGRLYGHSGCHYIPRPAGFLGLFRVTCVGLPAAGRPCLAESSSCALTSSTIEGSLLTKLVSLVS